MAQINFTIPDEHIQKILDAFANRFSYAEVAAEAVANEETPPTKGEFAKSMIINHIKRITKQDIEQQARIAAEADLNAVDGIDIT